MFLLRLKYRQAKYLFMRTYTFMEFIHEEKQMWHDGLILRSLAPFLRNIF